MIDLHIEAADVNLLIAALDAFAELSGFGAAYSLTAEQHSYLAQAIDNGC